MKRVVESYFKMEEGDNKTTIEDILDRDESILLRTKPKKGAYVFNAVFTMLPIALLWLVFDGFFIGMMCWSGIIWQIWFIIIPFFAVHLMPVWIWIAGIVRANAGHKNLEYVFTEKRIILRSGVVGIDYQHIYYSDITSVNLRVGIIDRMFKVGDIYITAKGKNAVMYDIPNPYFLLKKIQKIVLDIKTDILFPNDLRPKTNHGYRTKYVPDNLDTDNK